MINYQGRVAMGDPAMGDPAVNFNDTGEFKFALGNGGANQNEQATGTAVQPPPFLPLSDPFNGALKRPTQKANS